MIEDGRVIEAGTHDELVARRGGAYRRLSELQFGAIEMNPDCKRGRCSSAVSCVKRIFISIASAYTLSV